MSAKKAIERQPFHTLCSLHPLQDLALTGNSVKSPYHLLLRYMSRTMASVMSYFARQWMARRRLYGEKGVTKGTTPSTHCRKFHWRRHHFVVGGRTQALEKVFHHIEEKSGLPRHDGLSSVNLGLLAARSNVVGLPARRLEWETATGDP